MDQKTREIHKDGAPWMCIQHNVRASARDNTEQNTDKGHTCPRIENNISDPRRESYPGRRIEGKDSTDQVKATDQEIFPESKKIGSIGPIYNYIYFLFSVFCMRCITSHRKNVCSLKSNRKLHRNQSIGSRTKKRTNWETNFWNFTNMICCFCCYVIKSTGRPPRKYCYPSSEIHSL